MRLLYSHEAVHLSVVARRRRSRSRPIFPLSISGPLAANSLELLIDKDYVETPCRAIRLIAVPETCVSEKSWHVLEWHRIPTVCIQLLHASLMLRLADSPLSAASDRRANDASMERRRPCVDPPACPVARGLSLPALLTFMRLMIDFFTSDHLACGKVGT